MPSAEDVLIAAVGLVLTGAGLSEAPVFRKGSGTGTGFLAALVVGAAYPCVAVTWYEDGEQTSAPDRTAGKLRNCELALRRAGFQVEYTAEGTAECLLAWR
jgi:hypothetical protein